MDKHIRAILILLAVSVAGVVIYNIWSLEDSSPNLLYSEFVEMLDAGEISRVHIKGGEITGIDADDNTFTTFAPNIEDIIPKLLEKKVTISTESDRPSTAVTIFTFSLLFVFVFGAWLFLSTRRVRGAKASGFAKSKARVFSSSDGKKVTFEDVAGIPEAKQELVEIIDFLKNPHKFSRLGGRIPKGVLLQGPPGTGKTLLAKAIAGEAGVPFFSISGSDFVEMFVGVGASRVRDLFTEAKKHAPCIIFIDEIDAVGRRRGAGESLGGQDEREQTLNALLVEMDGFASEDTVVLVAATNRPDVLDPALLRPGRFDRQVTISIPDVMGRLAILNVHVRNIVLSKDVDLERVARGTPGFSGAELANLVNEAALMAARKGKNAVEISDFEEAKDKILMGAERKSLVVGTKERETTAYHEAGHAILAKLLPETDPVHKVSIIPRGRAMGITQQLPLDERRTYSKTYLINHIKILLGGRAAEEIVLHQRTTGAVNDLLRATEIATKMVCEWGMSDAVGPLAYAQEEGGFLGGRLVHRAFSEETAQAIDREIKQLVEQCYQETLAILSRKIKLLHMLAEILLMDETIDAEELDIIFECQARQERREQEAKR